MIDVTTFLLIVTFSKVDGVLGVEASLNASQVLAFVLQLVMLILLPY